MTITQLNYIIAVDTYRHFGKAAESCFVTQPTLSMQIQKLEDELGTVLFDRGKSPIEPTPLGKRILEQARIVVNEAERIEQLAQAETGKYSGDFYLGIIPTVATNLIYRFINRFRFEMPEVHLVIEELQTDQIIDALNRNELDAGLLATPLDLRGIEEVPIYYEPFMAFVPEGHRLAEDEFILSSELDLADLLLLNEGHCFRNSVINLCGESANKKKKIELESGNFETLIKLAQLGYGMTLLPYLTAIDLPENLRKHVKPIAEPTPSREISLIYSKTHTKLALVDKLAPLIRQSIPERLLFEKNTVINPQ
jgi:LysR family hydrogen peroxide-inducible transcriptional activator